MRRLRTIFAAALLTVALAGGAAGCGNDRAKAPDVSVIGPFQGTVEVNYPDQGIAFSAPKGWDLATGKAPLVATAQTGLATIAVWRYPRTEPLPRTKAQLKAARDSLIAAAKARDATFTPIKAAIIRVAGAPAIQIRATETIAGRARTVRSTHVYKDGAEIVIDAYAPAEDFNRVDSTAFRAVLRTLKVSKPRKA
jgi:hypothetical protein